MSGKSNKGWLNRTGRSLSWWLDVDAVEDQLLDSLGHVADKTRLDWLDLMYRLQSPQGLFHQGELSPAGDLCCTQCERIIHLYVPQLLQVCVRCGNPEFLFKDDQLH